MRSGLLLFILLLCHGTFAQSGIFGRWVTIDDNSGKKRSIVEITERGGMAFGKIDQLYREPGEEADPICDECDPADDRYNKKVIGMEFIRDMARDDDEWADGTIPTWCISSRTLKSMCPETTTALATFSRMRCSNKKQRTASSPKESITRS